MAKKVKVTKGGQTVYPATVMDAVVHPDLKVTSDKLIGEVNVSKLFPTGGTGGSNKYTLETAIAKIPASLRSVGIKCSFLNDKGLPNIYEWQGGTFTDKITWARIGAQSVLTYYANNLDQDDGSFERKMDARGSVPPKIRKEGMILIYRISGKIEMEYCQQTDPMEWVRDSNWTSLSEDQNIKQVSFITDIPTTRLSIPFAERKQGLFLCYIQEEGGLVFEQYIGNVFTDANWKNDANWGKIIHQHEIKQIIENEVDKRAVKRVGKNLFSGENVTNGYINQSGGISGTTGSYRVTDYIKVDGDLIANKEQGAGTNNSVYDSNKRFVRTFNSSSYVYQEGDAFVRYSYNSTWEDYMIEKGSVVTDYEPYTEDAPLLKFVVHLDNELKELSLNNIEILIEDVYISKNATGGVIERDFGLDIPTSASVSGSSLNILPKKGWNLIGEYTVSAYFITNQPASEFNVYQQQIEQFGKNLVKISRDYAEIGTYGFNISAYLRKHTSEQRYIRLCRLEIIPRTVEAASILKGVQLANEKRNVFNVCKDFDETTWNFGVTNFDSIIKAHESVSDSSRTNQYVIRCMPGVYDEFETKWFGSSEEPTDEGSYLGILVQDHECFESFDKECPSLTTLKWDGSAGFSESMSHMQAARRCIFHINMKEKETRIEGFTFDCKNVRYCIHPETAGQGWGNKWTVRNCILKFDGRPFVQPEDSSWTYIGTGLSNGETGVIERCKFVSNEGKNAIFAHNNPFAKDIIKKEIFFKTGARLIVKDCDLGGKTVDIRTTSSDIADTYDTAVFENCKNNAGITIKPYSDGTQNWKVAILNSDGVIYEDDIEKT